MSAPASTVGATLRTVTLIVSVIAPDSTSGNVTLIVYSSLIVPVGLSSRYWCGMSNDPPATATVSTPPSLPSPQSIVNSCVSSVPTSLYVPIRRTVSFSLIVVALSWSSVPAVTVNSQFSIS